MKRDLQAKFLMHMASKKQIDEGFTLIELLVVIIIIGILAAIALPSLLGQVNKAKQSEARNNTGTVNRAQQAYLLENPVFASTVEELEVGIRTQSENYNYSIKRVPATVPVTGITAGTKIAAVNSALPRDNKLKAYAGLMGTAVGNTQTNEVLSLATVCESKQVNVTTPMIAPAAVPDLRVSGPCATANPQWKDLGK